MSALENAEIIGTMEITLSDRTAAMLRAAADLGNAPTAENGEALDSAITDAAAAKAERIAAYNERIEEKRKRYAELAQKHTAASTAAYDASRRILDAIPCGQPILVGHHSEGRHRRDLRKADRNMGKCVEHRDTAAYYEHKAEGYGTNGISSADPAALDKLREKLANMIAANEEAKALNKHWRKHKSLDGYAIAPERREALEKSIKQMIAYGGSAGAVVGVSGAEIRRIKDRIAALEATAERGTIEQEKDGYTYKEDAEENRINFYFDDIPDEDTRRIMKKSGFKWSPSRKAWTRILNNAARYAAERVMKELDTPAAEA